MYDEVIIVSIVFASTIALAIIIGLVVYFAKRLEHKEILAAIEKGIPPSKLKTEEIKQSVPLWIKHISSGIIVLAVAAAIAFSFKGHPFHRNSPAFFVAVILCGVGIALIIRGLLYKKYQPKIQSADKSNNAENS
jgi:sterol desaturase/sphingolipid hydroxylase (fatty acid hydroxylase superfamily)